MPNMASEMATKAKWYHMVTLKIRVSRISSIMVASVIKKRPASVRRVARTSVIADSAPSELPAIPLTESPFSLDQLFRPLCREQNFSYLWNSNSTTLRSTVPHRLASGEGETGGLGNGPWLFTSDTSSNNNEGTTQETTGTLDEADMPREKRAPTRGMNSSVKTTGVSPTATMSLNVPGVISEIPTP